MKKLLLMCCFVMGISAMSYAQGGGGGGRQRQTPEEQAKALQTQLKLTDDQTAKITDIYKAQGVKMDSLRKAANGDMSTVRDAMRPLRDATTAKVKAVLTTDQVTAYDAWQKEMAERRRNGGGGGQGGGGGAPQN